MDDLARDVSEALYREVSSRTNPRGGPWQLVLYSFVANRGLGAAVLLSLSRIDFTKVPNGSSLDLRFDSAPFRTAAGRARFAGFLKAFVELGVMEVQISMVDTETLLAAMRNPEDYPHLMVKVAGYSARFIDLPHHEQDEIINPQSLPRIVGRRRQKRAPVAVEAP